MALGYFGFTYFEENQDKLKAVKVDGGERLRRAERRDRAGRHLHAAVPAAVHLRRRRSRSPKPQVQGFVEFYVENIDEIAEEAKFVPLTDAQKTELDKAARRPEVAGRLT